jgi:putative hydrolase of the HAD superfamily
MQTVLLVPSNLEEAVVEWWEKTTGDDDHIDFVTDDLSGFLAKIAG